MYCKKLYIFILLIKLSFNIFFNKILRIDNGKTCTRTGYSYKFYN